MPNLCKFANSPILCCSDFPLYYFVLNPVFEVRLCYMCLLYYTDNLFHLAVFAYYEKKLFRMFTKY